MTRDERTSWPKTAMKHLLKPDTYPKLYFDTAKSAASLKVVTEQN